MRIATLLLGSFCVLMARVPEAAPTDGTVTGSVKFLRKGKETTVSDAFVYLVPVQRGRKVAPKQITATIVQKNREFTPKRLVIPVGSTVAFPNMDRESHNVFSPTSPMFDLKRYDGGDSKSRRFPDDGEYDIYCDIHVEMNAKVKVVEGDRIVSIVGGRFSLAGVPAGNYKVVAWAPDSPESKETITVVAGEVTSVPQINVQLGNPMPSHVRKNGKPYPIY